LNTHQHPPQLAIVGAGFAGISTALHLQSLAVTPLHIHLFDTRSEGRGIAYGPSDASALLNVPVERMGLWSGQPEHFFHWLREQGETPAVGSFLPRQVYGDYLQEQLAQGVKHSGPGRLFLHRGEVVSLCANSERADRELNDETNPGFILQLARGQHFAVDQCVLALGNFPPAPLTIASPDFYDSPRYFNNPWDRATLEEVDPQAPLLILGTGLTAVDCVLAFRNRGHRGRIVLLSSHGHLPLAMSPPLEQSAVFELKPGDPLHQIVQQVRLQLRRLSPDSPPTPDHFQAVAMALRPQFSALWQRLPLSQQRQFLRHVMHTWGQMRHRLPPAVAEHLQTLRLAGDLQLIAGRVLDLKTSAEGAQLDYRLRGDSQRLTLSGFQRVINATGPCLDYGKVQSPLLESMMAQALIAKHPLGLGLQALKSGQLVDASQQPVPGLFTLGSALRGVLWECTAVPEIREQANTLAQQILTSIAFL
jgi:uncharacterized NAD(P)/FAD-binding protein YdhS